MSQIGVVVMATSPDIQAEGIAAAVSARTDMNLVKDRVVSADEVSVLLESIPLFGRCALILVGSYAETEEYAQAWLAKRPHIVVMCVDAPVGDGVRIALRDIGLPELRAC